MPCSVLHLYLQEILTITDWLDNDLIILHELDDLSSGLQSSLEKALRAGTSLLLIPGSTMNLQAVNSFLAPMGAVALEPFSGKR